MLGRKWMLKVFDLLTFCKTTLDFQLSGTGPPSAYNIYDHINFQTSFHFQLNYGIWWAFVATCFLCKMWYTLVFPTVVSIFPQCSVRREENFIPKNVWYYPLKGHNPKKVRYQRNFMLAAPWLRTFSITPHPSALRISTSILYCCDNRYKIESWK